MFWPEFEDGSISTVEGSASWETTRLEPVGPPTIPAPAVSADAPTPLFDQLANLWRSQSRQVPGEPDPEWHALVSRGPGRRRRPSEPRWLPYGW